MVKYYSGCMSVMEAGLGLTLSRYSGQWFAYLKVNKPRFDPLKDVNRIKCLRECSSSLIAWAGVWALGWPPDLAYRLAASGSLSLPTVTGNYFAGSNPETLDLNRHYACSLALSTRDSRPWGLSIFWYCLN